jgi:tRNA nucleotidyltransferase/poly(A) polymerase
MGKITKQIDIALKNCIPLLSTISPERIRDEFLKGIATAKSVIHYMQMLDEFGLFSWIFKGLEVDKKFLELRDSSIIIAVLLSKNQEKLVTTWKKGLHKQLIEELKYSKDEAEQIIFFLRFMNLSPKNAVFLKKNQGVAKVTDEQIRLFSKIVGLDSQLVEMFIVFKLTLKGEDIMNEYNLKPGKEVGEKLYELETGKFFDLTNYL